ncbi:GTP-binding protein TypA/BipA -like protein [Babesia sp. Xinjiang]|uniref:GTP-binding protein TypA/BipA -like protein n=1 Tax=Babesia sp. Xinjiang TaxID=462227 RepID=UPI000A2431BF|nr:GTP-binding protein TypA/BipA -like protein [Babesia sp. Xinjiang]ORM40606.1 GTP-binding protein TypA/BipA -like protein [Babesia sp. Xinjiang]
MILHTRKLFSQLAKTALPSNYCFQRQFSYIRNVAVVAHVDHGKTTLVDGLLRCSGENITHRRALDSHALEKERGITICSKVTRVLWSGHTFNIVDTPGHADFGGEVERILNIVDCVCLLIDVVEGPKPQTTFVLRKALENPALRAVVVMNKCDRECNKTQEDIENELFELFVNCGASDEQLEFPILFASAKEDWVSLSYPIDRTKVSGASLILESLAMVAPPPVVAPHAYFTLQVSLLDFDEGCTLVTGKVNSGSLQRDDTLQLKDCTGKLKGHTVVKDIFVAKRDGRVKLDGIARVGDIITIQCHKGTAPDINDTLGSQSMFEPLPPVKISGPVISVVISANTSPLAGSDGKLQTTAEIGKRLIYEAKRNLTIQVVPTADKDAYHVNGRGELQIGVLLENMRREGFEMTVSPLSAITTTGEDGIEMEALQELLVLCPSEMAPNVVDLLASRGVEVVSYSGKGLLYTMQHCADCQGGAEKFTQMEFMGTTTQFLGLMISLRDIMRGRGEIAVSTVGYRPLQKNIQTSRKNGSLISSCAGIATPYGLEPAMSKGTLFICEGTRVYEGMVIGESSTDNDLHLNVVRVKPVTGMRNKGSEQTIKIVSKQLTVEQALAFITHDEQLELTPKRIAIRKKQLSRR